MTWKWISNKITLTMNFFLSLFCLVFMGFVACENEHRIGHDCRIKCLTFFFHSSFDFDGWLTREFISNTLLDCEWVWVWVREIEKERHRENEKINAEIYICCQLSETRCAVEMRKTRKFENNKQYSYMQVLAAMCSLSGHRHPVAHTNKHEINKISWSNEANFGRD